LTTITKHTVGRAKDDDHRVYQDYDFTNKHEYTLTDLQVKDPSKFDQLKSKKHPVNSPVKASDKYGIKSVENLKRQITDFNVKKMIGKEPQSQVIYDPDQKLVNSIFDTPEGDFINNDGE